MPTLAKLICGNQLLILGADMPAQVIVDIDLGALFIKPCGLDLPGQIAPNIIGIGRDDIFAQSGLNWSFGGDQATHIVIGVGRSLISGDIGLVHRLVDLGNDIAKGVKRENFFVVQRILCAHGATDIVVGEGGCRIRPRRHRIGGTHPQRIH